MSDASSFVEALKRDALIEDVYYTGFSTGAGGDFVFTIDIVAVGWREEDS